MARGAAHRGHEPYRADASAAARYRVPHTSQETRTGPITEAPSASTRSVFVRRGLRSRVYQADTFAGRRWDWTTGRRRPLGFVFSGWPVREKLRFPSHPPGFLFGYFRPG